MPETETMNELYGPQPWFARGNRIRDNHGFDVCFLSCDPQYILNDQEKRIRSLLTAAPKLLEACKRIDADPFRVLSGDLDFLREAIQEAENVG